MSASISPVLGSIATIQPRLFFNNFSPYACKSISIPSIIGSACKAIVSYFPFSKEPTTLFIAEVTIYFIPFVPRNSFS